MLKPHLLRFFLPDSPATAKFLEGPDRVIAIERLRDNNMGTETKVWKWYQFWETFRDPKSYLWFALLFLAACVLCKLPFTLSTSYLMRISAAFRAEGLARSAR